MDFIEITYTGRVAKSQEIFDTTDEALARKSGIYSEQGHYGPQIICVGQGQVLKGLDEHLAGATIGAHTWTIPAELAFGKKNPQLIQLIPISTFKQQKIQPALGMQLNIDGQLGVVKVASGGRVLVDFNHPLAGMEITYDLTVHRIVSDKKEQLQAMLEIAMHLHHNVSITVSGDEAAIELPSSLPEEIAQQLSKHLENLCSLKKVIFSVSKSDSGEKDAPSADLTKHLNKNPESSGT